MTRGLRWMLAWGALAALLSPASGAALEQKWTIVSYIAKMDLAPVGDVEGHVGGPFVRRGLMLLPKGEVGVYVNAGAVDMTKGKGTAKGSSTTTFEDGSTLATTYTMTFEPGPGGKPVYKGTGEITQGTGRYAGIKGTLVVSGKAYTPRAGEANAEALFEIAATFTLPGA